jgi:hypothetical protein
MTSKYDLVVVLRHAVNVQDRLRIWMTIVKYHVLRVTPRVHANE